MPKFRAPKTQSKLDGTAPARLSIGLILGRKFTLGALANFIDVLRLAGDEGDRSRPILCEWSILSENMNSVRSSCGIAVHPTARLSDPSRFNYVGVVGGLIEEVSNLSPAYKDYLRAAAERGVPLLGICTGSFILHELGLMNGYRCCISYFHHGDYLHQFPGMHAVTDRSFVVDRDRLTCVGGASSAHLAAWIVQRHIGTAPARKSLRIMMIEESASEEIAQPAVPVSMATTDPLARKALFTMQQFLDAPIEIDELSKRLGVNRKRLERVLRGEFGLSPRETYLKLRLDQAEWLLETTNRSIATIAAETGFADSSHFVRSFRQRNGVPPAVFRKSQQVERTALSLEPPSAPPELTVKATFRVDHEDRKD